MSYREVVTHRLPDGREMETRHLWNGVDDWTAEGRVFMWTEGNWGCDDNKSLFIMEQHTNLGMSELPCGNAIKLVSLLVDGVQVYPEPLP